MSEPVNIFNSRASVLKVLSDESTIVELAAEHGKRAGLIIANYSQKDLLVRLGDDDVDLEGEVYSFKVSSGSVYEMPANAYQTRVTGIFADTDALGFALVTEVLRA